MITAGIKKYKSIKNKNKKKCDKTTLLAKSKLNNIEGLISEALIDSNIGHDEFVLIKNVRSLVVSDLRSDTKGCRFEFGCWLFAEMSSLQ